MIAIIAAMRLEVDAIVERMNHTQASSISGIDVYKGTLSNVDVIVLQSGVGKVNAAITTTVLLERFDISHVINIGTAGGLIPSQNVLDIVVSEQVVQHDYDTSALDGEAGRGLYFKADENMVHICIKELQDNAYQIHCGLIASGDQFISEELQLESLKNKFPAAICAEMEAGAIAQVCTHYHVPFVVLRSLSDIAFKEDSHMDFMEYAKLASERSALKCEVIVKQMMNRS